MYKQFQYLFTQPGTCLYVIYFCLYVIYFVYMIHCILVLDKTLNCLSYFLLPLTPFCFCTLLHGSLLLCPLSQAWFSLTLPFLFLHIFSKPKLTLTGYHFITCSLMDLQFSPVFLHFSLYLLYSPVFVFLGITVKGDGSL